MNYPKVNISKTEVGTGKNIFLYFAALIVHLTSFTCGIIFGWSSPVAPKLRDATQNPLGFPLSEDEITWLASLAALGAAIGPFAAGYLADKIGRKRTFNFTAIFAAASFLTLTFATHIYWYYVARLVSGICLGIFLTTVPMFIGEIAEVQNRGTLGCLTGFFTGAGNLYCFCVGPYISVSWFNLSCSTVPLIFMLIFITLIPETPTYLMLKSKKDDARLSLMKYRRGSVSNELVDITNIVETSLKANRGISDLFKTKYLLKALCITVGLVMTQQFTAASVIVFYMQTIFQNSNIEISDEIAVTIVGIIQILGTLVLTLVVDKLGRRLLLLASTITTCTSLLVLSIYYYLLFELQLLEFISNINWLPILALTILMFFYNLGIGPLPYTVISEIFPPHVKSAASSISVSCCFGVAFGTAKLFPLLADFVGTWFAYLVFACCNGIGVIFIWFMMPETKGRTLSEILDSLK